MVFDCTLEQFFNIKLFKITANDQLLFPTKDRWFEKLYTQISERKLPQDSL